jgi:hypothetical protein
MFPISAAAELTRGFAPPSIAPLEPTSADTNDRPKAISSRLHDGTGDGPDRPASAAAKELLGTSSARHASTEQMCTLTIDGTPVTILISAHSAAGQQVHIRVGTQS